MNHALFFNNNTYQFIIIYPVTLLLLHHTKVKNLFLSKIWKTLKLNMSDKIKLKNPPVVEVVIGAQFDGIVFGNNIVFDHYQKLKSNFPNIQEHPPLQSIIAYPDRPNQSRLLQGFHSRKFFINNIGDKLFQVQPDRILFNWRKNSEKLEYPRFTSVLEEFMINYDLIVNENETDIHNKLNQLEVTFVDHIVLEDFNSANYKLNDIFKYLSFPYEITGIDCNFTIPQETINGNLTFVIKSALRQSDKKRLIVCETTCRGINNKTDSEQDWFRRAHEILLDFFIDQFTDKSKKIWGEYK